MSKLILLTKYIDHTNLSPSAKNSDIRRLCHEALKYDFKSVCVHPCKIRTCVNELADSDVLICTVVGFPLGQNTKEVKVFETIQAVNDGANEIDMVINIAELKLRNKKYCIDEINAVVDAANGRVVKVIVETALLDHDEKIFAFDVVHNSRAHYIKTSTGFSTSGAKLDDIKLWNDLKHAIGSNLKIKAAGGVSSYDDMINFIQYGAERIGTSRGVKLFEGKSKLTYANLITYLSIRDDDPRKGIYREETLPIVTNKVLVKDDGNVDVNCDADASKNEKITKKRKPASINDGY